MNYCYIEGILSIRMKKNYMPVPVFRTSFTTKHFSLEIVRIEGPLIVALAIVSGEPPLYNDIY